MQVNAAVVLLGVAVLFVLAYRFYAGFLAKRIFNLDDSRETPAHAQKDGVDFVPTRRFVLLGHHFASITGAAPIVGPALAVVYGWLPALLWVVFGTIFMGAVSDFSALVISIRNQGRTLGDLVKDVIGSRGRILFLLLGICLFTLLMAVFPIIIASLFKGTPESVFPAFALIPIALVMGLLMYKAKLPLTVVTIAGIALMGLTVFIGMKYPMGQGVGQNTWVAILLFYSFIASIVPVWVLLQPRDYLNSFWLYAGLGLLVVAIFVAHPTIQAPAVRLAPEGAGSFPLFPFLFITIACGALSGVHALFASGTTSRQLDKETDAPSIGYGGMLLEASLAVVAIIACTAGVANHDAWMHNYATYGAASGLKLGNFVNGSAMFLSSIGISVEVGKVLVSVTVIGFALTTLDSSARILRFLVRELGAATNMPLTQNRWTGSAVCCGLAFLLATWTVTNPSTGKVLATGQVIWPTFGVANQVLACLGLLVVSLFLYKAKKPIYFTFVPMLLILVVTMYALILSIRNWWAGQQWPLLAIGVAVLICEIWLTIEGLIALNRMRNGAGATEPLPAEGAGS